MRLVAVSIVKNEADIIEPFVRHTLAWADHHLVFDHDSTDGTREILGALQAEGLPITVFGDNHPGHIQQARSNHLTRLAAEKHGADWVLPLDADEILCGPGRLALEQALQAAGTSRPASLALLDYCASAADNPAEPNPVLRLQHSRPAPSPTRKIFVPRSLAADGSLVAGKGSHGLYHGNDALPDTALPDNFYLAHLALRSPQHQLLRVARAELQRQSRGRAAAGLDVHYRLGYQLLAEDPELFLATVCPPATALRHRPVGYRGGALRHTTAQGWPRVARALFPYLEQLATSHGRLADLTGVDVASATPADHPIREIPSAELARVAPAASGFGGFSALTGWGDQEGPVPEAFLPPFHWGYAPTTRLSVPAKAAGAAMLTATMLTYSEEQTVTIGLNGATVARHNFGRVNQKITLSVPLHLRAGENELTFDYPKSIVTARDPRQLAVIFLSLQVAVA